MSNRVAVVLRLLLAAIATSILCSAAAAAPQAGKIATPTSARLPSAPAPVLGADYFLINNADREIGKAISVVEVFGYSCPHCAHFQPYVDAWKKKLPADVKFSYLPAAFGGIWDAFARAYYTAETMGVLQKSHDGIYNEVHVQHRPITNIDDIAALYTDYGVDKNVFASTMQSLPITVKVNGAQALAQLWGVDGTPTIVVAGKYRVPITSAGEAAFLRNVDWLVASERAQRKKH